MCAFLNNSLADSLFGSRNSIWSGSFFSASNLGDLGMMRSGVYTKLLRSYYQNVSDDKTTSTKKSSSNDTDSPIWDNDRKKYIMPEVKVDAKAEEGKKALSSLKSSAKTLSTNASALAGMDFDTSSRDEIYSAVKKMTDSYNSVLDSASKSSLDSISKSVSWMTGDTKARSKQMEKLGITIGADNKLTVDKDKFAKAGLTDIKSFFEGSGGFADRHAQRANGLVNLATNQLQMDSGRSFYSSTGVLR